MEHEPPGAAFFCLEPEPESAPGPWRPGAGAAQKSGGSAALLELAQIVETFVETETF